MSYLLKNKKRLQKKIVELEYIASFVELDWFVKELRTRSKKLNTV